MNKLFSTIQKTVIAAGIILVTQGCKIDVVPTNQYTEEAVWSDPANIELYINGMYSEFRTFKFGSFPIGYDNATDALTDIEKYTSSTLGNGTVNSLATNPSQVNAAGSMLNYWDAGYNRIRRVNEFISGIEKFGKVDEVTKKQYEAEARFVRGYSYFWLARLHGSIVLLDNIDQYQVKEHQRSSEDDVWKFIAADFAYAAENLPKKWEDGRSGRATKGAALGMLSRTWLYAASIAEYDKKQFSQDLLTGVPAANAQDYYRNAADAAQAVINLANEGYYALEPDFASIFTNSNTREAIFKIDFVSPQLTHIYDLGFAPPADAPGQCLVYGVPTAELVNEFEMEDGSRFNWGNSDHAENPYLHREQRFYASILFNGAEWKGRTINTVPSADNPIEGFVEYGSVSDPKRTVTGYYIRKSLNPAVSDFVRLASTQSWIEMRYAEILLIHAEAKLKLNEMGAAQASLNALRNERGLPNTTASNADQMMNAIEHERKVELAFEGHRYWDLRRWRKAHTVLSNVRFTGHKVTPSGNGFNYEVVNADNADRQFTPSLYYIPIPVSELQKNLALTQIQGW
jgi:hypothetical protein